MEELLPPSWVSLPFELLAETAAIAAIEMKLIGELHEVYGQPVPGTQLQRGYALARAWADQRSVTSAVLTEGVPALGDALGRTARKELIRRVRRRALRRTGHNLVSLGPLMVGGALGATLNRRSTRRLGEAVIAGLRGRGHPGGSSPPAGRRAKVAACTSEFSEGRGRPGGPSPCGWRRADWKWPSGPAPRIERPRSAASSVTAGPAGT